MAEPDRGLNFDEGANEKVLSEVLAQGLYALRPNKRLSGHIKPCFGRRQGDNVSGR